MSKSVVLCGYKRSPFTFASKGGLSQTRPDDMSAAVIKALLDDTGIDPQDCEDLLMGNAFPEAEQGFNLGRIVGQLAGLPAGVAGATLNRFCGSSMTTIHMAAGYLQLGAGEAYITAGVESMTRVPMGGFNPMPNPSLMESYPQAYISMGETAENLAKKYDITRKAQDEFAYESHSKAASAREKSNFDDEIIEVDGVGQDGCIRPDTSVEKLGELSPAFDSGGSVTAGTSAPLTDGAAAVLVASEDYAKQNGIPILARVRSVAVAGCASEIMGLAPVSATSKALERAGLSLEDIDIIELNEAFAAQSLAVIEELGIDQDKLNLDGGAIALGHPLGASGARISGKLASLLNREDKQLGLATMCVGGGQGTAIVLEHGV